MGVMWGEDRTVFWVLCVVQLTTCTIWRCDLSKSGLRFVRQKWRISIDLSICTPPARREGGFAARKTHFTKTGRKKIVSPKNDRTNRQVFYTSIKSIKSIKSFLGVFCRCRCSPHDRKNCKRLVTFTDKSTTTPRQSDENCQKSFAWAQMSRDVFRGFLRFL